MQSLLNIKHKPIIVFADDLTGAMEVGLQSLPAVVLNEMDAAVMRNAFAVSKTTIVLNTQTREQSAEQTYHITQEKSQALAIPEDAATYYKIDSTMRGHIGAGVRALRDVLQSDLVVIAPALPQNGRITRNGSHYVMENEGAVPVHETQYAGGIMTPYPTSHIPDIIGVQLGESVRLISLDVVRRGWRDIKSALSKQPQGAVVAIDAVIPEDLDDIAEAIYQLNAKILSVGSAGLFRAICRVLRTANNALVPQITDWTRQLPNIPTDGKVVVIAGSFNKRTDAQIEKAVTTLGDKLNLLEMDVSKVIAQGKSKATEIERLRILVSSSLQAKKHIIVRTNRTILKCNKQERDDIVKALGEIINDDSIMENSALLLLTGGQTAYFVAQVLGAVGIKIRGEIEKFVPVGVLMGGRYDGVSVVTKAGGFGSPNIIADVIAYTESKNRPPE